MARALTPRSAVAEQLVALDQELRGRVDLSHVALTLGRPAARGVGAAFEKARLPASFRAAYGAHDGMTLTWQERGTRQPGGEGPFVYGRLGLLPAIEGFYRSWGHPLGFEGEAPPELAWKWDLIQNFCAFDAPELDQTTRLVGFERPPRKKPRGTRPEPPPRVWYFNTKGPSFPLELDFEGYLSEAVALSAITDWQAIFADLDGLPESERGLTWVIVAQATEALGHLTRLFPGRVRPEHVARVERLSAG